VDLGYRNFSNPDQHMTIPIKKSLLSISTSSLFVFAW